MTLHDQPSSLPLLKRQLAATGTFGLLLAVIIAALYLQHRHREWILRCEQAEHRLSMASDLISLEVKRVRSDATYLANRMLVREFVSGDHSKRASLESDFMLFVQQKGLYDQLRLLDPDGHETIRVNFDGAQATAVGTDDLQNKADRYYFQASRDLQPGEIFVSDFDLNVEYGAIERPFKPVIRFVTPVVDEQSRVKAFIVLNYLGADLLTELGASPRPGYTLLLRPDGHYIRGVTEQDAWGWLLGHDRTFATQFPQQWNTAEHRRECQLTEAGAFAYAPIQLGRLVDRQQAQQAVADNDVSTRPDQSGNSVLAVSYLPAEAVFAESHAMLQRLLIFGTGVLALAIVFTRTWARATWTRQLQAQRISASEERLRELSSRLLRIQEDERRAISREIHDDLGQQATAINLDLKLALRNLDKENAATHLQRAIDENETLLSSLHQFAQRVRPAILDDLGLAQALESHLKDFEARTGVQVRSEIQLTDSEIAHDVADNTFRLVQESLNNVAKHAEATSVELTVVEQAGSELHISVSDDGRGSVSEKNGRRLGLTGMRERVDLLGGQMDIESILGEGTQINIRLPLRGTRTSEVPCP